MSSYSWRKRIPVIGLVLLVLLAVVVVLTQTPVGNLFGAALDQAPIACDEVENIPASECQALQALYSATAGAAWRAGNWFQTGDACTWYGLTCDEAKQHIIAIRLESNALTGPLPAEIGALSALKGLHLRRNALSGPLPAEIGQLGSLETLDLSQNAITGTLPAAIGSLGSLRILGLGYNQLEGSLPEALGQLTQLEYLLLEFNRFEGSIPDAWASLVNLKQLYLTGNQLSGPIPASIGQMSSLTELRLESNQFSGPIPPELGSLAQLQRLFVQDNQLSGDLPPELAQAAQLASLGLSSNILTGEIPAAYTGLTNLGSTPGEIVDLGYNGLYTSNAELEDLFSAPDPNWVNTQTVPPSDLKAAFVSGGALLTWTPIAYTGDGGYYEISSAGSAEGPFAVLGHSADKSEGSYMAAGLTSDAPQYFRIRSFTPPHSRQKNEVWSEYAQILLSRLNAEATFYPLYLPITVK